MASGRLIVSLDSKSGDMSSAKFSADGSRVLTLSANFAVIRDVATGYAILTLQGHEGSMNSAVFSPDGRQVLSASQDKTARLWNVSLPAGDLFHIACAWLPDTNLTDLVRDYGLPHLAAICRESPPLPDGSQ